MDWWENELILLFWLFIICMVLSVIMLGKIYFIYLLYFIECKWDVWDFFLKNNILL